MITDGLNPFTVLLFISAVLGGATLMVLYLIARVAKREPFARITLWTLVGGAGLYLLLFLGASVFSHNRVLAPGEEKHICEIDCHLAYAVAASKSESLPSGLVRHTVTVKVRFDEATISSRRLVYDRHHVRSARERNGPATGAPQRRSRNGIHHRA